MLPITTVPDKKVPTHGPGTTAWYRGKEAKILAIENGKAKIFCGGRVLLVNYTSLDDASFKTLHEAYRVVDNETHKSLFTGTKDECESFISDECDEDADVECIELKEAIMVPSDGMNPRYTLEKALSYAKGNAAAMIATNPLLYGIAALQRKYVVVCNVLDGEGTENPAYKKLDKDVRAKYHKLLSIPGESGKKYEVFGNKDNTSFLLYYEDAFTTNWFVPAAGKINESEAQDKYQEFFKKKLADYGVSSPAELSAEDKSKFFSEIKKEWPDAKINEAISIPRMFQYAFTLNELEFPPKQEQFIKKYLGVKVIQLPSYNEETGKDVKAFANVEKLINKSTKVEVLKGSIGDGDMIAYSLPQGTICVYSDGGEFGEPCFYFKPIKTINESLKNKTLFGKIEKWYSALSIDQKETLFYNLFRFSGQATKMAKKYKTLAQFVKMGTKNTPESGSYKHTGFGVANAIATYYQSFKTEKDILPKLASIEMNNSKDYLKYHDLAKGTALNEAEMAFGIGSTVSFNGKKCKVVSISNGVCKLVCDGEVMSANMGDLQPSNPINESADNESAFNAYTHFEDTLKLAKYKLPADIFKLFAKECFINGNAYILDKIVEEILKVVDMSPVNDLVKMAKTYNNGNYSDRINKFIYNTNNLRSLQTGTPFNQRYFDKCVTLLMKFGTNPSAALDEITADSMMFVPAKNQLEFFELSTECIDTIKFVVSKQSDWKVVKQTPTRIVIAVN